MIEDLFIIKLIPDKKLKITYNGIEKIKVLITLISNNNIVLNIITYTFECKNHWFVPNFIYNDCESIQITHFDTKKDLIKYVLPFRITKDEGMIFITGPGRTGTSVITEFLENLLKLRTQKTEYSKNIRAGNESPLFIKTICMFGKKSLNSPYTDTMLHNNIDLGVVHLKKMEYDFDLVKSPLLYYYNNYEYFKTNLKRNFTVILTKRNDSKNISKSSNKINAIDDVWKNTPLFFDSQNKINKNKLECLEIDYLELEFPKFVLDPEYLKNELKKYFNFDNVEFEKTHKKIFNKNLISFL